MWLRLRNSTKTHKKEINLEIEQELLGSEMESFRSQKIEDPTLLPFKPLPFPFPLFRWEVSNRLKSDSKCKVNKIPIQIYM